MNKRRQFVVAGGAGLCTLAAPLASFAQPEGKVWRVGALSQFDWPDPSRPNPFTAFQQGMRELGYVEGRNLVIERRYTEGNNERVPALVVELVALKVEVLITANTSIASALQKATTTIPIVITTVGDPVGAGLVKSLARPGGNITGLSTISVDIAPKRLEMLLTMVPKLLQVAVLVDPLNMSNIRGLEALQAAGQKHGVRVTRAEARTAQDIDNAFSLMAKDKTQALIVFQGSFFVQQRRRIAELAAKNGLPSISGDPDYAEVGGLMRYGASITDQYRRAATFVDKIFKGAKPGDLPIEQPTKFELVINRKTAKALGLTIPQSLLISADKVIE